MDNKLYKEELLDHYKHPRNKTVIQNPDFSSGHNNPSCGDKLAIDGKIVDGKITELYFTGSGCVISQATASMLTELCIGKTIQEVMDLNKDDITELVGIPLGPSRLKCALLSLEVLQQGLAQYQKK